MRVARVGEKNPYGGFRGELRVRRASAARRPQLLLLLDFFDSLFSFLIRFRKSYLADSITTVEK